MTDLLSELDHGPSALPRGSEVTLFNTRSSQEVMGMPSPDYAVTHMCMHPSPDYAVIYICEAISGSPHQSLPWLCVIASSYV